MKNLKYILVPALAGILFASCNTEPKGPTQEEIDIQVNAKVKTETDKIFKECDDQIMQAAQWKKDSILVKMGKMKASSVTSTPPPPRVPITKQPPVVNTPVEPTLPPKPPTIGNGKPKMGGDKDPGTIGNGKPRMGGGADTTVGSGKPKVGR